MKSVDSSSRPKPAPVRVPRQKRSQDRRTRIIEAAYRLFDEQGYQKVTMRLIADAAGVSLGTPYSYFRDKKAVFQAVLVCYAEELRSVFAEEIERVMAKTKSLEGCVYELLLVLRRLTERHRILQKDAIILSLVDEDVRRFFIQGELASAGGIIDRFLAKFEGQVVIRDPRVGRFLIHKVIDQIVEYLIFYEAGVNERRVFRELARMISGYLKK